MATTFSIVAVFVPVAFMRGIIGRFFFAFGITVAWAVLVSLFRVVHADADAQRAVGVNPHSGAASRNPLTRSIAAFTGPSTGWPPLSRHHHLALGHRKSTSASPRPASCRADALSADRWQLLADTDQSEFVVQFQTPQARASPTRARSRSRSTRCCVASLAPRTPSRRSRRRDRYGVERRDYVRLTPPRQRDRSQQEMMAVARTRWRRCSACVAGARPNRE